MQFLKNINQNNLLICVANILICLLILPYLWYGESIQIRVHDNLDSNIVWLKMALESGQLFSLDGTVDQIMTGLPINAVYGTYDISLLIFYIFGIFKGYVICKFLLMLVALWGMYFLLTRHIEKSEKYRWILISISFLFAILPFWSFGAHVAGIPFAMYALLNLRNRNVTFCNWVILFFFAFWSSLVLTGFFLLFVFTCVWLYDAFTKKKCNWFLFAGLAFLASCYIISHFHLFYSYLFLASKEVSVRTQFDVSAHCTFGEAIRNIFFPLFMNGDERVDGVNILSRHSVSNQGLMLIPVLISSFLMIKNKYFNKVFILLLIYCFLSSLYLAINETEFFHPLKMRLWSMFPMTTTRAYWLNSSFWYIIISISLVYLAQKIRWGKYLVILFITLQAGYSIYQMDYLYYKRKPNIKFQDFFSVAQFNDIKETINEPTNQYKVVSLGIHPSISQYNGFYTLDGYNIDYSIKYKKEFRKIIEKELSYWSDYYDKWGARCYLFTSDTDYSLIKNKNIINRELLFNFDQMKKIGADYLISRYEINTDKNPSLLLIKKYPCSDYNDVGKGAYWDLYLYKIQ